MLLKTLLSIVTVFISPAFASEVPTDLFGTWSYQEARCANGGKSADSTMFLREDSFGFYASGKFQRSGRINNCSLLFNGTYEANGNRISTNGKGNDCGSVYFHSVPNGGIEFSIKHDRLHIIWRDGSGPQNACENGGDVEYIYVKPSPAVS